MNNEFTGISWICLKGFNDLKTNEKPSISRQLSAKNIHTFFRKKFVLNKVSESKIYITADDYYKLYINGVFVSQGPAPGFHFNYYSNEYDVTSFLKEGENVIAVHCYYQGLENRVWCSGDNRMGMIATLKVGQDYPVKTDETFKCIKSKRYADGHIIAYDTQFSESVVCCKDEENWKEIDFDDSNWENAVPKEFCDYNFFKQPTPPLKIEREFPKCVTEICKNHYLIDFEKEIVGQIEFKASGNKGDLIEIRYAEELSNNGRARYETRCNCIYQDFMTLSGNGYEYPGFFDYKAFRYVEIIDKESTVDINSLYAIVRSYPAPFTTEFSCDNKQLENIWKICENTIKCGVQEVFVDCPTREKGQYLGDLTITAQSHFYLTGDLRLYKKALHDFSLTSSLKEGLLSVAPCSFHQEIADYSLQFPLQVLNYYKHSRDKEFLQECYIQVLNIINYFKRFSGNDGLLINVTEKWNLVDWPEESRDGYDFPLTQPVGNGCHNVINGFYIGALTAANEICKILSKEPLADLEQLKKAFIDSFYNKETCLFVDSKNSNHSSIHSNILPLMFDILPDGFKNAAIKLIKEKRLACSVYFSYFLLKALAKANEFELIFELLTCNDKHSWGNMLSEGATCCFEAWGKDQKWNTSLCHPWATSPIIIIMEDILGLSPDTNGAINANISNEIKNLYMKTEIWGKQIVIKKDNDVLSINMS